MKKQTAPVPIQHEARRSNVGKTPADELWVCETCRTSQWLVPGYPPSQTHVRYCDNNHKSVRMRRATPAEKEEALAYLKAQDGDKTYRLERWG